MNALKWINTIAFILMVGVNIAANVIPIGGNTTGAVSQSYPNLFTPAPVTFAIWGVIYLCMLLFVVFQVELLGRRSAGALMRDEIGIAFAVSCVLNIAWIFAWHLKKIELSTLLIVMLLISLIVITKRVSMVPKSMFSNLMVKFGFDIYFGWLIAATIANINVMLTKLNWKGFGLSEVTWTIIFIIVGAIITAAIVICDNRYFTGLAVMWAFCGILIKHISSKGYNGKYGIIITAAIIGIMIIFAGMIYRCIVPNPKMGIKTTVE